MARITDDGQTAQWNSFVHPTRHELFVDLLGKELRVTIRQAAIDSSMNIQHAAVTHGGLSRMGTSIFVGKMFLSKKCFYIVIHRTLTTHLCPSWSKGFDSSSNIFVCAGSNPVECIFIGVGVNSSTNIY